MGSDLLSSPSLSIALMMSEHYSDIQYDPDGQHTNYPIPVSHSDGEQKQVNPPSDKITANYEQSALITENPQPKPYRKICGLSPRTLWIIAGAIAVIIVVAAVGGGVGGSQTRHKSMTADQSTSQTSTTSSVSALSSPSEKTLGTSIISVSTSTAIGPLTTLLVDCPSSNNTLYTASQSSQVFRKVCSQTFISNGINAVSQNTQSLDSCIDLCAVYNVANAPQISSGSTGICNAVCWRATIQGDDAPGHCFGFLTTNSSGEFVPNVDARCNGAALINQAFI